MTERELFQAWMEREGVEFTTDYNGEGADLYVRSTHTEAVVSFRKDGTFEAITSSD